MSRILRKCKLFAAHCAVIEQPFRRTATSSCSTSTRPISPRRPWPFSARAPGASS